MNENFAHIARKRRFWNGIYWVGQVLYICLFLIGFLWSDREGEFDPLAYFTYFLSFIVLTWLAVFVRELGHVFFGVKAGLRVRQIVVGPFGVSFNEGKREFFASGRSLFTGFVYMILPEEGDPAEQMRAGLPGGPIFSCFWLLINTVVLFALWQTFSAHIFLFAIAAYTAALHGPLASVIPCTFRGQQSDMLLLEKLRSQGERDFVIAAFMNAREQLAGLSAKDFSPGPIRALLDTAVELVDRVRALLIAYAYWEARGDRDKALLFLDEAVALAESNQTRLGRLADATWVAKAFELAAMNDDAPGARVYLAKVKYRTYPMSGGILLTYAALGILDCDPIEVNGRLDAAEKAIRLSARRTGAGLIDGLRAVEFLRAKPIPSEIMRPDIKRLVAGLKVSSCPSTEVVKGE